MAAVENAGRVFRAAIVSRAIDRTESPVQAGDEVGSLVGLRIVVVEDDANALAMLGMILRDRRARVATVGGYADVLISGVRQPGRDGYELIGAVRRGEAGTSPRKVPFPASFSVSWRNL